jgi:hypothetical protein
MHQNVDEHPLGEPTAGREPYQADGDRRQGEGNANPSLRPAPLVSADRASSSAASGSEAGAATWTSVASTGSVGGDRYGEKAALAIHQSHIDSKSALDGRVEMRVRGFPAPSRINLV